MPTGLLMPIESISMRLRIGCTHRFEKPGICRAWLIRSSWLMPFGHCERGLNSMVVSNIFEPGRRRDCMTRRDLFAREADLWRSLNRDCEGGSDREDRAGDEC